LDDRRRNTIWQVKTKKEKKGKSAQPSRLVFSQGARTLHFFSHFVRQLHSARPLSSAAAPAEYAKYPRSVPGLLYLDAERQERAMK